MRSGAAPATESLAEWRSPHRYKRRPRPAIFHHEYRHRPLPRRHGEQSPKAGNRSRRILMGHIQTADGKAYTVRIKGEAHDEGEQNRGEGVKYLNQRHQRDAYAQR